MRFLLERFGAIAYAVQKRSQDMSNSLEFRQRGAETYAGTLGAQQASAFSQGSLICTPKSLKKKPSSLTDNQPKGSTL
jgi:hypothetical protein